MNKTFGLAAGALLAAIAAPSLAQAQNAYTITYVNLRAGPGLGYPVVFPVPSNTLVQSYGCLNDWSWCDVDVNGYRGWMAGDYIGYVREGRWVPVYDYGPRYNVPIITFNFGTYWDTHYRSRPWYRERVRWERYDRDHHDDHHPPRHRDMPKILPKAEAGKWQHNDNDRNRNDRNDHNDRNDRNDRDHNDGNRFDKDRNKSDNDNNKWNNNGRSDNDRRSGDTDRKTDTDKNRKVVTPSQPAPDQKSVTPPAGKQVVTPPKPQPKVAPPANQNANKPDDADRGHKGRGDANRSDRGNERSNDDKDRNIPQR